MCSTIWWRARRSNCGPRHTAPTATPRTQVKKKITLSDLPYAMMLNPRNAYQNYNCAINLTSKTIYTYMGVLRPNGGNANYATAGELSPLFNDPYYRTIGLGTRIFLGGAKGICHGTGHTA